MAGGGAWQGPYDDTAVRDRLLHCSLKDLPPLAWASPYILSSIDETALPSVTCAEIHIATFQALCGSDRAVHDRLARSWHLRSRDITSAVAAKYLPWTVGGTCWGNKLMVWPRDSVMSYACHMAI